MKINSEIEWPEYAVFGSTLLVSLGIGVYYGFFGTKQKTTKEYLLGDRKMAALPVSFSLVCSAVSALTLLGNPVEVYLYRTQWLLLLFSYIPFNLSLAYLYIPVYFNLKVNSAYEYIELRFNSTVRLIVSIMAVLQLTVSMAFAVYAPALAIRQVTGIDTRWSTAVIYFVCIFYSALGGLKSVIYTDVFQAFIMLASLLIVLVKGVWDVGGLAVIWEIGSGAGRIEAPIFDLDPRTRHTFWSTIIAGYFASLPSYAASQLQVQRFLAMPNISTARRSLILNFLGVTVIGTICNFTGIVIFAKYVDCDPIANKQVSKPDQLLPFFVSESMNHIPGLMGIFIAGLTCASMSTLSSGLSALASITTYDYVSKIFPNLSDEKLSILSKINCFLLGLCSYGCVYLIENMGNILPIASSILGMFAGPVLGLFSLGMFFPWANWKGGLAGTILSFILMILFIIGTQIAGNKSLLPDQRLPVSTAGCEIINATTDYTTTASTLSLLIVDVDSEKLIVNYNKNYRNTPPDNDDDDSALIQLLSVSHTWYSALGCVLSVFLGLVFSTLVNFVDGGRRVNSQYLSPPVLWLWEKMVPLQWTKKWLQYNETDKVIS